LPPLLAATAEVQTTRCTSFLTERIFMGLDMYLRGEKYFHGAIKSAQAGEIPKTGEIYRFGYWRKHPNLHGFIVLAFAHGDDDCRPIDLDRDNILFIMDAIRNRQLPHTEGAFFGQSECTEAEMQEDLAIFRWALAWLEAEEPGVWKSINYQASW
jgi:hypothetical protein